MIPSRNTPARDLLDFYAETGVDALLEESPVDRFAAIEQAAPIARAPRPAAPSANLDSVVRAAPATPPAPDEAVMQARSAAKNAKTLDELRTILANFEGCALKPTASQLVFADKHQPCLSAKLPVVTKTSKACHSSADPANCLTAC